MEFIGFTEKYYTLWQAEERGRYTYYTYVQNLSMQLEKAIAKRPNAMIDLTLKGHKAFRIETIPCDCFIFGKYRAQNFSECTDLTYLAWYYNALQGNKGRNILKERLINNGYCEWRGKMLTKALYDKYTAMEKALPMIERLVSSKSPLSFKCDKNLKEEFNENGEGYATNDNPIIKLIFKDYENKEYKGYKYAIPCLNNFSVSIKNRKLIVNDYDAIKNDECQYTIIVKSFNIE